MIIRSHEKFHIISLTLCKKPRNFEMMEVDGDKREFNRDKREVEMRVYQTISFLVKLQIKLLWKNVS